MGTKRENKRKIPRIDPGVRDIRGRKFFVGVDNVTDQLLIIIIIKKTSAVIGETENSSE